MKQKKAWLFQKKYTTRMSEKISKKVQDAIDGIMRNDPTMTDVHLSCEIFSFLILLVEIG